MQGASSTRRFIGLASFLAGSALALSAMQACASGVTVGAGSSVDFGNASINLGCADLNVAGGANANAAGVSGIANLAVAAGGTFAAGSSRIALGGDFADTGTFAPGTGQMLIGDACGNGVSHVTGGSAFYDLLVSSSVGKQLVFPAGIAQSIAHAFALQGAAGNLLQVLSSTPGSKARLTVAAGAAQTIAYVNARDNDASAGATIAPGAPSAYHSVDAGNLVNWFGAAIGGNGGGAVPAPALGHWAALLLAALLATFAWRRSRLL
ncbi:hypothetical protein [Rudaea sp.]|uniref:hypothetical protein n=1 Tax=Rudaea sp. TaxID=2136325 RepID=UPI002ED4847C